MLHCSCWKRAIIHFTKNKKVQQGCTRYWTYDSFSLKYFQIGFTFITLFKKKKADRMSLEQRGSNTVPNQYKAVFLRERHLKWPMIHYFYFKCAWCQWPNLRAEMYCTICSLLHFWILFISRLHIFVCFSGEAVRPVGGSITLSSAPFVSDRSGSCEYMERIPL